MSHPVASSDCVAWYRGDSLVDGGGGVASAWNDKTANGYNLTPSGSPTIVDAGLNGRLAANYVKASSQGFSRATTPAVSQPLTVACIARVNDLTGTGLNILTDTESGNTSLYAYDNGGNDTIGMYAGGDDNEAAYVAEQWHLHVAIYDGAGSELFVDNVSVGTANVGSDGLTGFRAGGVSFSGHLDGRIAEAVVWDKVLDSGERDALYAYYLAYYFATGGARAFGAVMG
jgi:hypothetical protein